jgi:hypothetical protein
MKRLKEIVVLMSVLGVSTLTATLNNQRPPDDSRWGYIHWPLKPIEDTWWFAAMGAEDDGCDWLLQKWASVYSRTAGKAFFDVTHPNSNTIQKTSLAQIVFGSSSFTASQASVGGVVNNPVLLAQTDPLLGSAALTPNFDISDTGLNWGAHFEYSMDDEDEWAVGVSVMIPFKVIEVNSLTDANSQLEETVGDMFQGIIIEGSTTGIPATEQVDIAIRMDFLRSIAFDEVTTGMNPLLYLDSLGVLRLGGQSISTTSLTSATEQAYFMPETLGTFPAIPYRKQHVQATGALPAAGGGVENAVLIAINGAGYATLFADQAAMSELFMVLRASDTNPNQLTSQAQSISERILKNVALSNLSDLSAVNYLAAQGLDLAANERVAGIGDLDMELYLRYNPCQEWYFKGSVGATAPTGTRRKEANALHVYRMETGNNGHWEIGAYAIGAWRPVNCFGLSISGSAHHVFGRDEWMPASFQGATVKNLGPAVEGNMSWDYFTFSTNFSFYHPQNCDLGCVFGYQLWAKTKDSIKYTATMGTDFLGQTNQILDPTVAEQYTDAMSHKFRLEIFHRWNFFELFGGASRVFAGAIYF